MEQLPAELAESVQRFQTLIEERPPEMSEGLSGIVERMIAQRTTVEMLDEQLKDEKRKYDDIRKRELPEAMMAAGLIGTTGKGSFTHKSGARIYLKVDIFASIPKDVEDEVFGQLKATGHKDLIKETINNQTLRAWVRELMDNGEPIPPGIQSHTETVAVLTIPKEKE